MLIYFLIFFLLLVLCLINYRKHSHILYVVGCALLIIVAGLRDISVGNDLEAYVLQFLEIINRTGDKVSIEIIWGILNDSLRVISDDVRWFIFSTSFLSLFPLFLFIFKNSKQPSFSLLLFFIIQIGFCFYMTGLRQSLAMSLTVWAFYFFENKKYIFSSVFLALAVGIHASAIFCLPFLFLPKVDIKKNISVIILAISVLLGFIFRLDIFAFFKQFLFLFSSFNFYEGYSDYYREMIPNFFGLFFAIVPLSVFAYFGITKQDDYFSRVLFYGTILNNVFASTPQLPRYFMYFTIFQIIVIPNIYKKLSNINKTVVLFAILVLIYYFFGVPYITGTTPYKFYSSGY